MSEQRRVRTGAGIPPATDRVRVRRLPERGRYDRATIDAVLDAALIGHVGYVVDGQPFVTPTAVWRSGDRLYWHGSSASRMLRATQDAGTVCVTATLVDGLVLARSGFNHSMNYRSVMVLGRAALVTGDDGRLEALRSFVEHLFPGRWAQLRAPTRLELKATTILWTSLDEASVKVRTGGPHDDPGDESWPVWVGIVPIGRHVGSAVPDPGLVADLVAGLAGPVISAWLDQPGTWTDGGAGVAAGEPGP
ncbi:MAG TPA: pyridoxamine 5'-phosphate oxidase family protein [Candidatus Saccharimonadales bacterium]|nr:pyridoxamine 5'-phosphate oxidase family protein [Candidatus Saccharimonadales bacterium]